MFDALKPYNWRPPKLFVFDRIGRLDSATTPAPFVATPLVSPPFSKLVGTLLENRHIRNFLRGACATFVSYEKSLSVPGGNYSCSSLV